MYTQVPIARHNASFCCERTDGCRSARRSVVRSAAASRVRPAHARSGSRRSGRKRTRLTWTRRCIFSSARRWRGSTSTPCGRRATGTRSRRRSEPSFARLWRDDELREWLRADRGRHQERRNACATPAPGSPSTCRPTPCSRHHPSRCRSHRRWPRQG